MKKRLRDVAAITVGYQVRGGVKPAPLGDVHVIQMKDLDVRNRLSIDDLVAIRLERSEAYHVQAGDVLFLSRGHRLRAATIGNVPPNTVAAGYFFVLRPKAEVIRPTYLAWWLNSPDFQSVLRPLIQGTHMPLVSKSEFQDLRVPVPSLALQERIVAIGELLAKERQLEAALQEKRAALIHAASMRLINDHSKTKDK